MLIDLFGFAHENENIINGSTTLRPLANMEVEGFEGSERGPLIRKKTGKNCTVKRIGKRKEKV